MKYEIVEKKDRVLNNGVYEIKTSYCIRLKFFNFFNIYQVDMEELNKNTNDGWVVLGILLGICLFLSAIFFVTTILLGEMTFEGYMFSFFLISSCSYLKRTNTFFMKRYRNIEKCRNFIRDKIKLEDSKKDTNGSMKVLEQYSYTKDTLEVHTSEKSE